ncbi:YkvA family protein [Pannonibacter sp. Pt2-lr]|uniref:YkvA family protein n=1 Tax=Pannonibacter anstelovis TaxID=3121537 RepID=A0ABU7ZR81_9HYPH
MSARVDDFGFDPEILGPELGTDEQKSRRIREKLQETLRKAARQVPFMEDVVAAYFCALDPATPRKVRATLLAALAYFVLPLDVVPDFILGIGFGDDATVLMGAIAMVRAHMRPEHSQAAKEVLAGDKKL